jgi:predicted RNase H-like HicB family nuclease
MRHEFLAMIERVDDTHVAYCPEVPGIFGRGRTKMAALVDLREAVVRTLAERREQGIRDALQGAVFDTIQVR